MPLLSPPLTLVGWSAWPGQYVSWDTVTMQEDRGREGVKSYLLNGGKPVKPGVQDYQTENEVYPDVGESRYYTIKVEDGRKIPRSPPANPSYRDKYVSAHDPEVWFDLETIEQWCEHLPSHTPATVTTEIPTDTDKETVDQLVLLDFDDVRNDDTGEIHGDVFEFIESNNLHAAISYSGTGVHAYARASIPVDIKPSCTIELSGWEHTDNPELELYAANRPIALTGEHIKQTPVEVTRCDDVVVDLLEEYSSDSVSDVEANEIEIEEAVVDVDKTTDVDDILSAVEKVKPSDIRIKSTSTNERSDGTVDIDPCWEQSDSGTRVGEVNNDCWIYRAGNSRLNALQIVALEEGIINDAEDYPSGQDFWNAVEELRNRGADIPEYESGGFDEW